jgi:hypothetical protein
MAEHISALLRRSLQNLEDEVPDSYQMVLDVLGPIIVHVDVDGELFSLSGSRRVQVTDGPPAGAHARITSSRAAIVDLLDARVSLDEAVRAGFVVVHGALDHILRIYDTFLAYVHAAVRAPSHPELLTALREGSA